MQAKQTVKAALQLILGMSTAATTAAKEQRDMATGSGMADGSGSGGAAGGSGAAGSGSTRSAGEQLSLQEAAAQLREEIAMFEDEVSDCREFPASSLLGRPAQAVAASNRCCCGAAAALVDTRAGHICPVRTCSCGGHAQLRVPALR